jgi:hypothetical protein
LCRIALCRIALCRIALCRIALCRIALRRIALCRIDRHAAASAVSQCPRAAQFSPRPWLVPLRFVLLAAALAAVLAACTAAPPPEFRNWESYLGLIVPGPIVPIEASGSVQFNYRGQKESGEVLVQGNGAQDYRLRVSARLLGTAALEVRFSRSALIVLDFSAETYFLGANDPETREKLFSIDLGPDEFPIMLTGRIPRGLYEAGHGHKTGPNQVEFENGAATYRFELDFGGLPRTWSRIENGEVKFRVEYREYASVTAGGGVLRLPKKIRVYADEAEPRIILGVREYRLGSTAESPVKLAFDPPAGLRYQGLEDAPTMR